MLFYRNYKAEYYFYRRLLFYAAEMRGDEKLKPYAAKIEDMMRADADRVLAVSEKVPCSTRGDRERLRLFLKDPEKYYRAASLYEKTVVRLKNLRA